MFYFYLRLQPCDYQCRAEPRPHSALGRELQLHEEHRMRMDQHSVQRTAIAGLGANDGIVGAGSEDDGFQGPKDLDLVPLLNGIGEMSGCREIRRRRYVFTFYPFNSIPSLSPDFLFHLRPIFHTFLLTSFRLRA